MLLKLSKYSDYLGMRYNTFRYVFENFENKGKGIIVELGTTRSYVSGGYEGCMSIDKKYWKPYNPEMWDWGAGCFTRVVMDCLSHLDLEFYTVDICDRALSISRTITEEYKDIINYHCISSVDFLKSFQKKADIIYMDAGETGEDGALLHLEEAKIIINMNLLNDGGLILIDDVNLPDTDESKGKYSIPYLLDNNYDIVMNGYQTILKHNDKL
jgi:hypothetical protein